MRNRYISNIAAGVFILMAIAAICLTGTAITNTFSKILREPAAASLPDGSVLLPAPTNSVAIGTASQYGFLQTVTNCVNSTATYVDDNGMTAGSYNLSLNMTDYLNIVTPGVNLQRFYLLQLPAGFDISNRYDVIIHNHGTAGLASNERADTNWDDVGSEHGYIMVFPQGMGVISGTFDNRIPGDSNLSNLQTCWNTYPQLNYTRDCYAATRVPDDTGFISLLIDNLTTDYNIGNVFMSGFSAGAGFTMHYAFQENRTSAFSVYAGNLPPGDFLSFNKTHTIPTLILHGTDDTTVEYAYINETSGIVYSAEVLFASFGYGTNKCVGNYTINESVDVSPINPTVDFVNWWHFYDNQSCVNNTELWSIYGGDHSWYNTFTDIIATWFDGRADNITITTSTGPALGIGNYTVHEGGADGGFITMTSIADEVEGWRVSCNITYLEDTDAQATADAFTVGLGVFGLFAATIALLIIGTIIFRYFKKM